MNRKTRVILWFVHLIARIQGGVIWVKRRFAGERPKAAAVERHLVYLAEGPLIRFMGVAIHTDKIIEQYGILGQPAPREQHPPAIRDNILERVMELIEDQGYVRLDDLPGCASLEVPVPQGPLAVFEDFLADRGLGLVTGNSDEMLTLQVADPAFAKPLIDGFIMAASKP